MDQMWTYGSRVRVSVWIPEPCILVCRLMIFGWCCFVAWHLRPLFSCQTPHRKKTHLVSVKCQNCSKTFRKQKNLEMHIERIHILPKLKVPKDRYTYCDQCEYKSLQRLNVKRHMVVHTRSRSLEKECDNCGYQFKKPYNLTRHKQMNRCRKDLSDKDKTLILTWTGN